MDPEAIFAIVRQLHGTPLTILITMCALAPAGHDDRASSIASPPPLRPHRSLSLPLWRRPPPCFPHLRPPPPHFLPAPWAPPTWSPRRRSCASVRPTRATRVQAISEAFLTPLARRAKCPSTRRRCHSVRPTRATRAQAVSEARLMPLARCRKCPSTREKCDSTVVVIIMILHVFS